MSVKLEHIHIQEAVDILHKRLPDSSFVYFPLRELQKGSVKGCVWVDKWPDFKAVVITPAQWSDEDGPDLFNGVFTYGSDDSDILCLCMDPKVIDPSVLAVSFRGCYFRSTVTVNHERVKDKKKRKRKAIPVSLWNRLNERFLQGPSPLFPRHILSERRVVTYIITDVTYNSTLPDGFEERELAPADSKWLHRYWFQLPNVENYISDCIRVTGISVCVMNEKKEPVAWSLRHIYGSIGSTFVLPEYRNLGLGKYVTAVVARKVIQIDSFCLACIEVENEKSMKLHELLGFKKYKSDTFCRISSIDYVYDKVNKYCLAYFY